MLIDSLAQVVARSGALDGFWGRLDAGEDATLGVAASARPFVAAARFAAHPQTTLVVVAGEDAALAFHRSLRAYLGEERVLLYPGRTDLPGAARSADLRQVGMRNRCMHALAADERVCVVASARSLLRAVPPAADGAWRPMRLAAGRELSEMGEGDAFRAADDLDGLLARLVEMGYVRADRADVAGTFAARGGTVDVFPAGPSFPVRLDFFGDELEDIRRIVPATGQTIASLPSVDLYPACEFSFGAKGRAAARKRLSAPARTSPAARALLEALEAGMPPGDADMGGLLPYVHPGACGLGSYVPEGGLAVLVEPRSLFDDAAHAFDDLAGGAATGLFMPPERLDFGSAQRATYLSIMAAGSKLDADLPVKRTEVAGHPEKLYGRLRSLVDAGFATVLSVPNPHARRDMRMSLVDYGIPFAELCEGDSRGEEDSRGEGAASGEGAPSIEGVGLDKGAAPGEEAPPAAFAREAAAPARLRRDVVNLTDVDVPLGMIIPKARLAIVAAADTQGPQAASARRRIDITEVTFPYAPGDYVVHSAHGVALFKELVRQEVDGVERDYLLLQYAEGDKLFVPVDQLDRVTRYVGPEGASPRLTRLNTSDWSGALARARKATRKLAFDLVDVYSRRAAAEGFRFSPDTPWQREMEESFPYEETPDQLAAIADVKADMESAKPMDRLVCGDVGFGKTEVALRAAFKATQDGKQVMVLCPTTILAQQHYTSFKDRFDPFGVRVEVLSRFRTAAQQAAALEGFAAGKVDVLVGTHRLLSRDVNPHDLGLVVVDEEQRFGVGHKEQLKSLRESVDVLTLSATPIPRTMQMALSGVRDMSLILTPPGKRRPVKVHVGEWDPDVVSAAIRAELARGGQVYYVSNRVRSIDDAVRRVAAAAGEARIGVAHGQMGKDQLERVMEEFSAGRLDVLVATTIIESGIDNPHTNTLVIEDSQRLGLAQMYQLKGRVGRSSTQAFAYFMFPEKVTLTEEAAARLTALSEHQDLGSGMRIAMRDLEIRGAGSLLGAEQSGNMSQVGFDLFAQMLEAAVSAAREGAEVGGDGLPKALSDIVVNLPGHTYLPQEYVPDADERVLWYRKVACAATVASADEVASELSAKRPGMPAAAENLMCKARIRAFAAEHHVSLVSVVAGRLVVQPVSVPRAALSELRRSGARYLAEKRKLQLPLRHFKLGEDDSLFEAVYAFLQGLFEGGGENER